MSGLKIINNQINADDATPFVLLNDYAINVLGNFSNKKEILISGNQIYSNNNIYSCGINLNSEIKKINITQNNISGFNGTGIFIRCTTSDGYSIITDNFISRDDGQNISYFILGSAYGSSNSTAIICNNILSHDTVDGANWKDCIAKRGTNWIVEKNVNQTEEITVNGWEGDISYREDPITVYKTNYKFNNKFFRTSTKVTFMVDNSISRENNIKITLLTGENNIYKKQAWDDGVFVGGPYQVTNPVLYDAFQNAKWGYDVTAFENSFIYGRYVDWIKLKSLINGNTFYHPFYVIRDNLCNIDISPNGEGRITNLDNPSFDRIRSYINGNTPSNPQYSWNNTESPARCMISGSSKNNNGYYEVSDIGNIANTGFNVRRIIGYSAGSSTAVEKVNLSNRNNIFVWSVSPGSIIPENATVIGASYDLAISSNLSDDYGYYSFTRNAAIEIQPNVYDSVDFSQNASIQHTLSKSGTNDKKYPIRVVINIPAIADTINADVTNFKIKYKW